MPVDVNVCKDRLVIIAQFSYQPLRAMKLAETSEKKLIIQMASCGSKNFLSELLIQFVSCLRVGFGSQDY